ncbi:hypothetical protein [Phaeobacter phage MD18]|nr:hypothetical protein [Phaeobacter phage MD18]
MGHENVSFTIIRGTFECKFCDKAASLLEQKGVPFETIKLGMADLVMKQAELKHPTVPMIMHGARFIGGSTELEAYLN